MNDTIDILPTIGGLGAEIKGINLAAEIIEPDVKKIQQCLCTHHVILFRDQILEPAQQCAFASKLGSLKQHPFIGSLEGHPEIMLVKKEPDDEHNFAGAWHTDTSYQETPALASMLYAIEVPENLGDTMFCNMVAACEALSPEFRNYLSKLQGVHSFTGRSMAGREQDLGYGSLAKKHETAAKVLQPVIRTHPDSGMQAIYVNPMFTESILGLTPGESDAILDFLFGHCIKPEFLFRLRWQAGTVAIWDNLTTMHYPLNDYAGHKRVMHRVVIAGTDKSGTTI